MRGRLLQNILRTRRLFHEYVKPRTNSTITYSRWKQVKQFSTISEKKDDVNENSEKSSYNLAGSVGSNYKPFDDKDADIILDINEDQGTIDLENLKIQEEEIHDPYEGINLERGVTGVFDIEDLVSLLRKDNAINIFVASVPPEMAYVDYIVVTTGKSQKHMQALATFVRKVFKLKRHGEPIPKIEGKDSKDWIALDLGNIALHIFSKSARRLYDLETLWSVGPDYDEKTKTTDIDIMDQFNTFLSNFKPIEENNTEEIKNEAVESNK